jgi:DNA-directed RNA polymerase subunit RPC12/RpoP
VTCEYCNSSIVEGEMKCGNCGAPIVRDGSALRDFRSCPMCHRKLLALASPACNYCGRRLPDEYIKARESDLKRITEVAEGEETSEVRRKVDELIRQTARNKRGHSSSPLGLVDITSLIDLFR